ncbi:MAG: type II toxin-antitoxin system VapC family toxin [Acidobacteriia bacterium]|nr:type II toxin-antitoxin system VapC family toxin [Terriglobia bacterium]
MTENVVGIVIDASVALAWCFPDKTSDYADAVLVALRDKEILVPAIWSVEITYALRVGEHRKRIRQPEIRQFVELLRGLRIVEDRQPFAETVSHILPLAREHNLSAYNTAYLDVCVRHAVPLVTLDTDLQKAARAAGIEVLKV